MFKKFFKWIKDIFTCDSKFWDTIESICTGKHFFGTVFIMLQIAAGLKYKFSLGIHAGLLLIRKIIIECWEG